MRLAGVKKYVFYAVLYPVVITGLTFDLLSAQDIESKREIKAYQLTENQQLKLDGRIEEAFWSEIEPATGFRMQEPEEGARATEKTEVRIAYDREYLYIGAILYDSEPSKIRAKQKRRDVRIVSDERFSWIFDTFNDRRNAYFLEVNPNGLKTDALITAGQGFNVNYNWDGIWNAETVIGEYGWSVEIRIPFRTFNFNPSSDTWGANFMRVIRRKNETVLWTGFKRSQGIFSTQDTGKLTGLTGMSQGLGLEVVPYGILEQSRTGGPGNLETSTTPDAGFDVNYSITPSLKASLTFNTDFAEAEVDRRRINLTRFPLFFPEQRDFFLEGSNIYEFAPSSGVYPFFSRRIGLRGGQPVPITYGARVLGNAGAYNMALLHVRTGKSNEINAENFTVARVKRNIGSESTVGFIYTQRATRNSDELNPPLQDRHTLGADLELSTSTFLNDKNLQFQAFFIFHNSPFSSIDTTNIWDRSTRGIRLNFPNQPWSGHVSYREFGNSYNPAVGFAARNSFRRLQPSIGFSPQLTESDLLQQIGWGIRFEHLTDLDFRLLTQDVGFQLFDLTFSTGDEIRFDINRNFERLRQSFDIKRDGSIILPAGKYATWSAGLNLQTASYRDISIESSLEFGEFWSGNRRQYSIGVTLRPIPGLDFSPEYTRTDINLAEGNFTTDLFRFEGNIDFTTDLFLSSSLQFDNLSDVLGLNTRLRWIITPGSDLFLVYNHNWLQQDTRFNTLQRTATSKISYTHRF